ncbi:MAG: hypothetical protein OH338_02590 [Candidatus Parvarchaeota archaeon]|nr:hypothetical protein [Candidatus Parvarchaeota archaeon]MCW1294362.1 hypothetical protein [Candidatus Parvarchaeum tengchongense]MCW1295421.1 hypothetical protein [Candidatus Parvarchaeum tengchongense]MCW1299235.1 hypothetical protein [Candidatus Parvarchaeum tengchongense]MCW1312294.1 hypothetical protein [Candidatus Parvarchaeum tengchongense]
MKKIELHEVNADLVQARESAVAVKALQDEIENEMAKLKDYNLRYNHGEISRQEHEDMSMAAHEAIDSMNDKIKKNLDVLFSSINNLMNLAKEQEPASPAKSSKKKASKSKKKAVKKKKK